MAINYAKRQADIEHYMPMVPKELPPEVDKWLEDVCFGNSQYLAYDRDSRYMYCTHCGKHISMKDWKKEQIHQLVHLRDGNCPVCNWEAQYICMGRYSKRVMRSNTALFLIAQQTPEGIVFRRFELIKQVEKDKESLGSVVKTTLFWHEAQRVFNDGTEVKYYCQNYVFHADTGWGTEWIPSSKRIFGYTSNQGYVKQIPEFEYTGNIQDVVKETCFQYAMEYKERCNIPGFLEKLMTWIRPVEYLERMKWPALLQDIRKGRKLGINLKAITPEKMLRLSRQHIKLAAAYDMNLDELVVLRREGKAGRSINPGVIKWLAMYADYLTDIRSLAPKFDPYRICPNAASGTRYDLYLYKDYLKFCKELEYDLTDPEVLYPRNLRAAHDREMKRIQVAKDAAIKKKVEKRFNEASRRYGFVTPTFLIRPPVSLDEIHAEGAALHHCVGTYAKQVADGTTTILFLRNVSKPDKPLFTLEWRNGRLIQIRGDHNIAPTPEVAEFVQQWQEHLAKPKKQTKQQQPAMTAAAN